MVLHSKGLSQKKTSLNPQFLSGINEKLLLSLLNIWESRGSNITLETGEIDQSNVQSVAYLFDKIHMVT